MSKELELKKAYEKAVSNMVITSLDANVKKLVVKNVMMDYVSKKHYDISEKDIEKYITDTFRKEYSALIDFTF